ncbi:MAG: hypothetical protein PHV11_05590 [Candidatus Bipolaricaulis sp.]|jgi:hypothetical protein|nr:hypothetical protein [Candidatus Bipolaricaulis sp.]
MMVIFKKDIWFFGLSVSEYEVSNFGYNVGELKMAEEKGYPQVMDMDKIKDYLISQKILVCTYRGAEDINMVRYLSLLGFLFVGTFSEAYCRKSNFNEIKIKNDLKITKAEKDDYEEMKRIQASVFDYSTYQLDSMFPIRVTSERNVKRLSSYFINPHHISFVSRYDNNIIGFLQFVIDGDIAHCVNGAVSPGFQKLFVGMQLYSESFRNIFGLGATMITSAYCNQNVSVMRMHQAFNFKVTNHEIHLRLKV